MSPILTQSAVEMVAAARVAVEQLTVEEVLAELANPDVVLIDLRETDELISAGTIPGAIHVPRGMLEFRADPTSPDHDAALRPDRRVILHCTTGGRSVLGAVTLARMGYGDVAHLDGGINAWIESGQPTVSGQ